MELGAAGLSEVDGAGGTPASGPDQTGGKSDDRLEFQLEVLALVVLALIGLALWLGVSHGLFHQIAPNLMASAIVGLALLVAYGRLLRKKDKEETQRQNELLERATTESAKTRADNSRDDAQIGEMLAKLVSRQPMIEVAEQLGVVQVFRHRPTEVINPAVLNARHTVNILEISLKTMREITDDQWRGCKADDIRIILLDPLFPPSAPLALQRDREEHPQFAGQILTEVHDFLHKVPTEWLLPTGCDSRVKLAQTMPTLSYFRIDDKAYFSPLVHSQVGDATLHLELVKGGQFFEVLAKHFEALWKDKERVTPARIDAVPRQYPDIR